MVEKETGVKKGASSGYTSILYFHGMGEQRRYEEISRLVDALDIYSHHTEGRGILKKIRPRMEPPRGQRQKDVSYIRVLHGAKDKDGHRLTKNYRFYECYWAPIIAGGRPALDVIKWLAKQILTPLSILGNPWRSRQRLRRSAFLRMWEKLGHHEQPSDIKKILNSYDGFEGPVARRKFPKGSFKDYLAYLSFSYKNKPNACRRLVALASRWRIFCIWSELFNLFILVTLFLAILIGALAMIGASFIVLKALSPHLGQALANLPFESLNTMLMPNWKNVSALLLMIAALFGITSFLSKYLGDVQFWTTYEETDEKYSKRKEILKRGLELFLDGF